MKKLLTLLITSTILLSCGKSTIEVKGTVVGEDKVELNTLQKVMTDMHECNLYMIETSDKETYFAMTPSLSVDPLDSGYVGTFVLSDVVTKGTSKDYVNGALTKTRHEFRNLISY